MERRVTPCTAPEDVQLLTNSVVNEDTQNTADTNTVHMHSVRPAASKAIQKMKQWNWHRRMFRTVYYIL